MPYSKKYQYIIPVFFSFSLQLKATQFSSMVTHAVLQTETCLSLEEVEAAFPLELKSITVCVLVWTDFRLTEVNCYVLKSLHLSVWCYFLNFSINSHGR